MREIRRLFPVSVVSVPNSVVSVSVLYRDPNIHHFGITKRKVMASTAEIVDYKLRPQVTFGYKLRPQNHKLRVQNLQV